MAKKKTVPLVVTTEHKGVFFGYGQASDGDTIRLEQARMCVYWSEETKSVLGLASSGPLGSCKIGPAVPAITLRGVTSCMEATKEAAEKWELGPWR